MDKSIIVTGANGFIGANLCHFLTAKGYNVACLVRKKADIKLLNKDFGYNNPSVSFYKESKFEDRKNGVSPSAPNKEERKLINLNKIVYCDFSDREELATILSEYDIIIHLAGLTRAKNYKEYYEANVLLTKEIVEIVNKSKKCIQLIYLSSQAATGPSKDLTPKTEKDIENPISWYGLSKYIAEKAVKSCKKDWTIIRPASVYGEGDKDFLFYFKMINKHISPIIGKKDKYVSLIYVKDLVEIISKCLLNKNAYNIILHASDNTIYKIDDFIAVLRSAMDKNCFVFNISNKFIRKIAFMTDVIYSFTKKVPLLNGQKAIELSQDSWLMNSDFIETNCNAKIDRDLTTNNQSDTSSSLQKNIIETKQYTNLKRTFLWYQKNGYL